MSTWTDERHEAARARCEAATDGPWDDQPDRTGTATIVLDHEGDALWDAVGTLRDEDGEFIAHARTDLPALLDEVERLRAELERGEASDGSHTHNELYRYRMLYNAHAARGWVAQGLPVVKSWRHADGGLCFGGGWFIVMAELPTGQVSNHYEEKHWDLFDVPEVVLPPAWDGHTPEVAADRLEAALTLHWKNQP